MKKFILILCMHFAECVVYSSIPSHLLGCYRGGGPTLTAPRRLDVFLDLLRSVERQSTLDMRLLTTNLLKSLRLDGIEEAEIPLETEFVTPYRASGFQFHKYKLLMDLFIPSQDLLDVDVMLSLEEKCYLHKMLSSSVYQWERGDENDVCPEISQTQIGTDGKLDMTRLRSRCPIEEGVIQTDWGTISPGTVIAAIAAALEYQRVSVNEILKADVFRAGMEPLMEYNDTNIEDIETLGVKIAATVVETSISNVLVATLAGDLAEVAINQGPRTSSVQLLVGSDNKWNDTLLPRRYYLLVRNASTVDWHFTDAEILGSIDGLILAHYIPAWVSNRASLKLSQILDMYYSTDGVIFEPKVKACNRKALFKEIFEQSILLAEMSSFAQLLGLSQGTVYMKPEELDRICKATLTAFVNYVPTLLDRYDSKCSSKDAKANAMDLVVATDGSWRRYDVEQFLSWIGSTFDLNFGGGSIALLHGNSGHWIAPACNNLTSLFDHIANYTDEWPNKLNLENVLTTINQYSMNRSLVEISSQVSVAPSTLVLIISPGDRPSQNEVDRSRDLMETLRNTYFDVYFAYVAEDLDGFKNVNNREMDYSELFIKADSTAVLDVIKGIENYVLKPGIPKKIIGPNCPVNDTEYFQNQLEDFALPNRNTMYRIHSYYLKLEPLVSVNFRNSGQGSLLVCWWQGADGSHICQTVDLRQTYSLNVTNPCPSVDFCPPVHISVSAASSENLCANNDCLLPHQVGYYMDSSGLKCLSLKNGSYCGVLCTELLTIMLAILYHYYN